MAPRSSLTKFASRSLSVPASLLTLLFCISEPKTLLNALSRQGSHFCSSQKTIRVEYVNASGVKAREAAEPPEHFYNAIDQFDHLSGIPRIDPKHSTYSEKVWPYLKAFNVDYVRSLLPVLYYKTVKSSLRVWFNDQGEGSVPIHLLYRLWNAFWRKRYLQFSCILSINPCYSQGSQVLVP